MPALAELPMIDTRPSPPVTPGRLTSKPLNTSSVLDRAWLRELCLGAGADDVGFVQIDRSEIHHEREDILKAFPRTKTLISFAVRMNLEAIRSPARSIANLEFHHTGDHVNDVAHQIVRTIEAKGVRALNPAMGFPMEMDQFPGKIWVLSHKIVAVAAGLGQMGIHRNVIHPKFGNFILLGTILMDAEVATTDEPIDFNPCLECKLCVAAYPVGAIGSDGYFNFSTCYTHNYREFMGGFTNWVEQVAENQTAQEYQEKVSDAESASMWQSLSFGANYKAAYCMAVCPAGDDVISPFKEDRKGFVAEIVKPLQAKEETIYVVPGSDAKAHVTKRFPHKRMKPVGNGLRPRSIRGFLDGLPLVFQRNKSKDLTATYHFTFTGQETWQSTVIVQNTTLQVLEGNIGKADFHLTADSQTWLGFLAKKRNMIWALLRGKIRVKGPVRLLKAFNHCFPS